MKRPLISAKKEFSIDLLRVLAVLMILALHTVLSFTVRADFFATKLWLAFEPFIALSKSGIYLFFMLSGYLVIHKQRTVRENLEKTWKRIFIPIAFFSVLNIVLAAMRFRFTWINIDEFVLGRLHEMIQFPTTFLWFLAALLSLYLLNPIWFRVFDPKTSAQTARYLVALALFTTLAGFVIQFGTMVNTSLTILTGWIGFAFFYLYGGLAYNKWVHIPSIRTNLVFVGIGLVLTMAGDYLDTYILHNSPENVWLGYYLANLLRLSIILMAVGLFNLIIYAKFDWLTKVKHGKTFQNVVQWFAGISFGVYLVHTYIVWVFTAIGFDYNRLRMSPYLYNVLNYLLVLGLSALVVAVVRKVPLLRKVIGE